MSSNRSGKILYTNAAIIKALDDARGGIFLAADKLGCSYKTIERRAKKHKSVQQTIDRWRGRRVDRAEIALDVALANAEAWAIMFTLRTQGKSRGYVERQELTGKDGDAIKVVGIGIDVDKL